MRHPNNFSASNSLATGNQPLNLLSPPYVLLDTQGYGDVTSIKRSYAFQNPEYVITALSLAEVPAALKAIDEAQEEGFYTAGWVAYEVAAIFEDRLMTPMQDQLIKQSAGPLVWMMVCKHRITLNETQIEQALHKAQNGTEKSAHLTFTNEHRKADYLKTIRKIQDYINAGDVYQINYTYPMPFTLEGNALALYAQLRQNQPVPYGAYIDTGEMKVLSMSPELLIERTGDTLTAKPMKGTAPRGLTLKSDNAVAAQLKGDEKSQAENLIIVDLIRNDLSRVSTAGSVQVKKLFETERYKSLWQMTSTVKSRCRPHQKPSDILKAVFPCGSVTGAPKVRAMEIIAELENHTRGVYCGAIGSFSPSQEGATGDFKLSVPIRTLTLSLSGEGCLYVGSGIVADSYAAAEFQECQLKSAFIHTKTPDFAILESMCMDETGQINRLEQHLQRLQNSAEYFEYPFNQQNALAMIKDHMTVLTTETLKAAPHKIRLLLGRSGSLALTSEAITKHPDSDQPLKVCFAKAPTDRKNPFLYHKTTHRSQYDADFNRAVKAGFADIIYRNQDGLITEGAISNLFMVRDDIWHTTPISSGLLAGIARQTILNDPSIKSIECPLTREDITGEGVPLYICNSVRGIRRVYIVQQEI